MENGKGKGGRERGGWKGKEKVGRGKKGSMFADTELDRPVGTVGEY